MVDERVYLANNDGVMGLFLRDTAFAGDELAFIPRELILGFAAGEQGPNTCNAINALFRELGGESIFRPYFTMKAVQLGHDNVFSRVPHQWSEDIQDEMQGTLRDACTCRYGFCTRLMRNRARRDFRHKTIFAQAVWVGRSTV
jgi:hypothetical protein